MDRTRLSLLFGLDEFQGDGVDAVPLVCRSGVPLTFENMSEVTTTIVADDFCTMTISIRYSFYGSWNFIIKTRPAAMRIKFILAEIKRGVASPADIHA